MNSTKSAPVSARRSRPASAKKPVRLHASSAYRQADKEARRGDPLPAKNQQERSPKQENL